MNVKLLLTAATLAISTAAFAASDSVFERTLSVSGSPNVSVSTGSGYIRIKPGSDNQVHIVGHVHAGSAWFGTDRDSRVQQIVNAPPISQSGNDITIGERHSSDLFRNISIDYDITLPRSSNIAATTGSGDMEIQDVGASLKAQTGSGSIRASGIQGGSTLGTGSGDVELHQSAPGDVKAETGSGSLRLFGVSGALKASTGSGDIRVEGQPTTDWKVSTGSGSIELALGGSARFNLDADTGSGSVRVDQPIMMQGNLNRHHVSGTVNGGGPTIRANTGSGDISIK
jgi:Putative adhesin